MANERANTQVSRVSVTDNYARVKLITAVIILLISAIASGCGTVRLKDAEIADQAERYAEAANMYQTLYRKTTRNELERKAYFAFKAAENYYHQANYARALGLYTVALNYKIPDSLVLLRLAECYRVAGKNKEAQAYYNRYLAVDSLSVSSQIGLQSLSELDEISENRYKFNVTKASKISSSNSDFSGCFSPDGAMFYFTSARNRNPELGNNPATGEKNNQLYYIRKDAQGKWSRPDSVPGGINTGGDVGTPAITPDGSTLYYSFVEDNDEANRTVKIYRSSKSGDGGWSQGQIVPLWSDTLRMAAHPAISANGKMLYFVSDGGFGGKDIYSIPIDRIGSSVLPTNLGALINTAGDEVFPTAVGDSMLYFASNGRVGLGGFDIYVARIDTLGSWRVSHLGTPINSSSDDISICFTPTPQKGLSHEGYFSSARSDRRGYPHFYSFSREAILTLLEGFVMDREENPIEGAVVRIVSQWNPEQEITVTTRVDGYYTAELMGQTAYVLHASHPQFLNQYTSFRTDSASESTIYGIDFVLSSRIKPEVFQDIYYDFDKSELRPESKRDLDAMARILKENPDVLVEISSHADRKGSDSYNITLSDARAQSVVDYLLKSGIDKNRLKAKGYGKTKPRTVSEALKKKYLFLTNATTLSEEFLKTLTNENEVAICDQLNRRTEFTVIQ